MAQPQSSPSTSATTTTTVSSSSRTAVSQTPALESPQFPPTWLNWEGDREYVSALVSVPAHWKLTSRPFFGSLPLPLVLDARGFRESVQALYNDTKIPPEEATPPINAPQGLLFEWWVVFWDISRARRQSTSAIPVGSDAAHAYLFHQAKKGEQQQQQQEVQMRINAQQQAPPQWAPQVPQLGAGRPGFPGATQMQGMNLPVSMHFAPRGVVNGNTQMPQPGRSYVAQPVQVNSSHLIAGVGSSAAQNSGAPQPGQPSQITQMSIANAHKFAQNGLTIHPPASQSQQQSQQSGGQPQPTHSYQQSAVNRGIFPGSSQQIPAANQSPPQSNPNSNSSQHPQQAPQPNPRSYSESNVNAASTPASLQTSLVRQPGQLPQPQQPLQQHPQQYGATQAQAPTPRPPQQVSTAQTNPAYPHSASTTPAPNQPNIAMAQGQPSPSRDAILSRPHSRPHSQPQSAQPAAYPTFGQYGSGPGGVFAPPGLGLQGPGTSRETAMGILGLAIKKDLSEGGSEIDVQSQPGTQKVTPPTRPLGRPGTSAPSSFVAPTTGGSTNSSGPHPPQPPSASIPPGHVQAGVKRPGSPSGQYGQDSNQDARTPDLKRQRRNSLSSDRVGNSTGTTQINPGQGPSNPQAPGYSTFTGAYSTQPRAPIAYTQPRHNMPMNNGGPGQGQFLQHPMAQRIPSAPNPGAGANTSFMRPTGPSQNQSPNQQNPSQPQQGHPQGPLQAPQQQQSAIQSSTPGNPMLANDSNRQAPQALSTDAQSQVATLNRPPNGKPRMGGVMGSIGALSAGRGFSSPSIPPSAIGQKTMMPPPQTSGTSAPAPPGASKEKGKDKDEPMPSMPPEAQNGTNTAIALSPMIKNPDGQKPSTPAPSSTTFSHPSISPVTAATSNTPGATINTAIDTNQPGGSITERLSYSGPISQPSGSVPLSYTDDLTMSTYFTDYSDLAGMSEFFDVPFQDYLDMSAGSGGDMDDVPVTS
ncbi:uncharacterized protein EI90DRAFT_3123259 [Cantharellus anzutake]|uniref:uncharacterized protein n=1 Tax=Cantharellus anzutake TaxID=1750568 RepID=UPI0019057D31|nr:uncharacterized protein EI90DRAFT_3123259 [Cantharellus anzutake]KAF8331683.1 hypothetical protein EI90DRAFT_3123259 [Cantharellus anzutake]